MTNGQKRIDVFVYRHNSARLSRGRWTTSWWALVTSIAFTDSPEETETEKFHVPRLITILVVVGISGAFLPPSTSQFIQINTNIWTGFLRILGTGSETHPMAADGERSVSGFPPTRWLAGYQRPSPLAWSWLCSHHRSTLLRRPGRLAVAHNKWSR